MFLVGKDILYGLDLNSYIQRKNSEVILTIPTDSGKYETFSFDDFLIDSLEDSLEKENILLKNVSVTITNDKTYVHSGESEPGTIYALLRVADCIPDDVFINKKHLSSFELIKEITYTTCEPDYGSYTTSVYFVKITLKPDELAHVYFAGENADFLNKHIAFYCDDDMQITFKDNLQTFVTNDSEFICLSEFYLYNYILKNK